ncbi:hypothetical protein ACA910_017676 [Epithemia clementina (nom. ined.)]
MSSSSSGDHHQHQQQQHYVEEAALAVVHPHTDPQVRASASQFLESWTQTVGAWEVYVLWLQRPLQQQQQQHEPPQTTMTLVGMQLLCLQLLQAKIRRDVPRNYNHTTTTNGGGGPSLALLEQVHHALARILLMASSGVTNNIAYNQNVWTPLIQPASICYAALSIRCGGVPQLVTLTTNSTIHNSNNNNNNNNDNNCTMPPSIALGILSQVPLEMEACADLTTPQVAAELLPYLPTIQAACCYCIQNILQPQQHPPSPTMAACTPFNAQQDELTAVLAMETLERWTKIAHVSLSQLNTPFSNNNGNNNNNNNQDNAQSSQSVLPVLVQVLSTQRRYPCCTHQVKHEQQLFISASRTLTEAILVPTDACTNERFVACQALAQSMTTVGFVAAPLEYATQQRRQQQNGGSEDDWDAVSHALATVVTTLVTEEVDWIVTTTPPISDALTSILVQQIQPHPHTSVACAALECWLTIQDVPSSQRSDYWKAPLFERVVECLLQRFSYPSNFSGSWDDDIDDNDHDDWVDHHDNTVQVMEESDFFEFRRMVSDVLVSCYYLLRVGFVQRMVQPLLQIPMASYAYANTNTNTNANTNPQPWFVSEACLFALNATARDVCSRIHAKGGGSSVLRDREETTRQLCLLAQHFCGGGGSSSTNGDVITESVQRLAQDSNYWLVFSQVCEWMGAYAAVWASANSPDFIYQLLQFQCRAMQYFYYSNNNQHDSHHHHHYSNNNNNKNNKRFALARAAVVPAASKALKNIMVGCGSVLVSDPNFATRMPACVQEALETVLHGTAVALSSSSSTSSLQEATVVEEQAMVQVAEGCVRLVVQSSSSSSSSDNNNNNNASAVQSLLGRLTVPVVQHCEWALHHILATPNSTSTVVVLSEPVSQALDALNKYMHVLQVMIQFSEPQQQVEQQHDGSMMNQIWPFLERASQQLVSYEPLLQRLLSLHEQLLKTMPWFVAPRFEPTLKYVMHMLEVTQDPTTLSYMGSAIEAFGGGGGGGNHLDFGQVLNHVFRVISSHLFNKQQQLASPSSSSPSSLSSTNVSAAVESTSSFELIAGFFQLCGRYLLYAPAAIAQSPVLPDVVSMAVAYLQECRGEGKTTRDVLNFLTKLYGWRYLPISLDGKAALEHQAHVLDKLMWQHGARIVQSCIDMLVGGSQILWGSSSDCVFTVIAATSTNSNSNNGNGNNDHNVARQWLESVPTVKPEHVNVYGKVIHFLILLAAEGPTKNKAKAKLLLADFSNILRGEASEDVLVSYSLPP